MSGAEEPTTKDLVDEIRFRRINPAYFDVEVKDRIRLARETAVPEAVQPLIESLVVALEECLARIEKLDPSKSFSELKRKLG
jgi:hypothetical protein